MLSLGLQKGEYSIMNRFDVYIRTHQSFSNTVDCVEFDFKNVDIEDTANYITLYDENGILAFKCHMNDIAKFIKLEH